MVGTRFAQSKAIEDFWVVIVVLPKKEGWESRET
jgi:hypothetical protein